MPQIKRVEHFASTTVQSGSRTRKVHFWKSDKALINYLSSSKCLDFIWADDQCLKIVSRKQQFSDHYNFLSFRNGIQKDLTKAQKYRRRQAGLECKRL